MHILKCHASKLSKTASGYIGALAAKEGMFFFPLTPSHGAKTELRTLTTSTSCLQTMSWIH